MSALLVRFLPGCKGIKRGLHRVHQRLDYNFTTAARRVVVVKRATVIRQYVPISIANTWTLPTPPRDNKIYQI